MVKVLLQSMLGLGLLMVVGDRVAGQKVRPSDADAGAVVAAIDRLGSLDYDERMNASRAVRRASSDVAYEALVRAVEDHADGYVRFRALILLSGFPDSRVRDTMSRALADPNDRLREVAYGYFEHHPDPALIPRLLEALEQEESEFVRPALVRVLTALDEDPRVRDALLVEVDRGVDFFRSAVIESLGNHRAAYAVSPLVRIALEDGPLQDDAALALGKIGDPTALETLATLQRSAPDSSQPTIAAAICLLGVNCADHQGYLRDTLAFAVRNPGHQELARAAASGLGAIAHGGDAQSLATLFDLGGTAEDPVRAPVALAIGTVAFRQPELVISDLVERTDLQDALLLLRDAFDMLNEDLEEERFFTAARSAYWDAPQTSRMRTVTETLIEVLEF